MSFEKQVPEIRFKGAGGEWGRMPLGSLCLIGDIDHRMPESKTTGIPYLMTGDFYGVNGLDFENAKLISIDDYEQLSKKIKPEYGDIIFARYASVGAVRYVDTRIRFLISYSCAILKTSGTSYGKYLFYFFQTSNAKGLIELDINTGSQRNIGIDSLKKLLVSLPKPEEQAKVGNTFQKLDSLINKHQQKHDKLSSIKKAMLEKMFPKQGETTPEIRFKGFSGEWVKSSLLEEAIVSTGFPFDSSDFSDSGDLLVITNGNIQNNSSVVDGKNGNRIASKKVTSLSQYRLKIGDILVTMDGSVGRTAKVIESDQILAQRVGRLVAKNNTEFLYQSLKTGTFLETMTVISHGGTIKHISLSEIGSYILLVPKDSEEQARIGGYLKNLDYLTEQHQQQITKLNNIKQACLSKMFV